MGPASLMFLYFIYIFWLQLYQYKSVRVDFPQQFHVNGQSTPVQDAVFLTIRAEHVPP